MYSTLHAKYLLFMITDCSLGDMVRPKCQSCVDSQATCSYTTLKRKPGPRKGSTNVRERKLQEQLGTHEIQKKNTSPKRISENGD
jgi:hypothetical protein